MIVFEDFELDATRGELRRDGAVVAHVACGRLDKARAMVRALVDTNEYYRLGALRRLLPFKAPEDLALIIDSLEIAGLPE